jgi:hypothetical protein
VGLILLKLISISQTVMTVMTVDVKPLCRVL